MGGMAGLCMCHTEADTSPMSERRRITDVEKAIIVIAIICAAISITWGDPWWSRGIAGLAVVPGIVAALLMYETLTGKRV